MSIHDRVRNIGEWKAMVEAVNRAIDERDFNVSEWESDFLESIQRALNDDRPLSPKQDDCLLKIWLRADDRDK